MHVGVRCARVCVIARAHPHPSSSLLRPTLMFSNTHCIVRTGAHTRSVAAFPAKRRVVAPRRDAEHVYHQHPGHMSKPHAAMTRTRRTCESTCARACGCAGVRTCECVCVCVCVCVCCWSFRLGACLCSCVDHRAWRTHPNMRTPEVIMSASPLQPSRSCAPSLLQRFFIPLRACAHVRMSAVFWRRNTHCLCARAQM